MKAQVVAINFGNGTYQMQRWNPIENIFLNKSSWCVLNTYVISRAIGFQNLIIVSRTRLTTPAVQIPAPGRDSSNSLWKPSAAPPHGLSHQMTKTFRTLALFFGPATALSIGSDREAALRNAA